MKHKSIRLGWPITVRERLERFCENEPGETAEWQIVPNTFAGWMPKSITKPTEVRNNGNLTVIYGTSLAYIVGERTVWEGWWKTDNEGQRYFIRTCAVPALLVADSLYRKPYLVPHPYKRRKLVNNSHHEQLRVVATEDEKE